MAMVSLTALTCIRCGAAITLTARDRVFRCTNCGTTMESGPGGPVQVDVAVAPFSIQSTADRLYIPFWEVDAEVLVQSEVLRGGRFARRVLGHETMQGRRKFYLSAADASRDFSRFWNRTITGKIPSFTPAADTGVVRKLPVFYAKPDAAGQAEFLFLMHELDTAGTLQSIEYEIRYYGYRLVYLPFTTSASGTRSALPEYDGIVGPGYPAAQIVAAPRPAVAGPVVQKAATPAPQETAPRPTESPKKPAGPSLVSRIPWKKVALALGGVVILAVIGIFFSTVLGPALAGLSSGGATPTSASTPTTTAQAVEQMPKGTEVVVQVQKGPPNNQISVIYAGGPGEKVTRSVQVTVTRSDGREFSENLALQRGSEVDIPGTSGKDRVQVFVTQSSGSIYRIMDVSISPRESINSGSM